VGLVSFEHTSHIAISLAQIEPRTTTTDIPTRTSRRGEGSRSHDRYACACSQSHRSQAELASGLWGITICGGRASSTTDLSYPESSRAQKWNMPEQGEGKRSAWRDLEIEPMPLWVSLRGPLLAEGGNVDIFPSLRSDFSGRRRDRARNRKRTWQGPARKVLELSSDLAAGGKRTFACTKPGFDA